MPTTNIIGYLWSQRQALDIKTPADVLSFAADLQRLSTDVVRLDDIKVLGNTVGTSVQLVEHTDDEWASIVFDGIMAASVENAALMLHEEASGE